MAEPVDIDSPLKHSAEDDLGRGDYANRVAEIIAKWRGDHSAVFAIYGEWGSGKTTFKNFVLEQLKSFPESEQPLIVEFNPWEWEGPRQVTEAFFAQLTEQIGKKGEAGAEVSRRLGRYGTYFTLGASIAESAEKVLPFLLPVATPIVSLLKSGLQQAGEQTKAASESTLAEQSLADLRKDLIGAIRNLKRVVLVAIDDVDRLTTAETAALFQLLKSNADFPNIVYLVLCDRDVVARNLARVVRGRGDEYLEKIVQLGLPLPKAYPEQLRATWRAGILDVIRVAGVERLLDQNRLWNMYDDHAESFFRTMRDVKRFVASLKTLLPAFVRAGQANVDLVDFVGIEIIRLFDHALYEQIYSYRWRIIGASAPSLDKDFLEKLRGNREPDGPVMGIFLDLFPRFSGRGPFFRAPGGISHPRSFDRYFAFAIPSDQYSPTEESDIFARRGRDGFVRDLEAARTRRRLQHLLELLAGAKPSPDPIERVNFMASLGDFADSLSLMDGADERESYRDQITRLVYDNLRDLDLSTRSDLLVRASEQSSGVWFPARFSFEDDVSTKEASSTMRDLVLERIATAGVSLRSHPALGELLLWQLDHGDAPVARAFAEAMLERKDTLFDLLHAFSRDTVVNTLKPRKRREAKIAFARELARLIPIAKILRRLSELDEESLTWNERDVIRAVRDDARRMAETDRLQREQDDVEDNNDDDDEDSAT